MKYLIFFYGNEHSAASSSTNKQCLQNPVDSGEWKSLRRMEWMKTMNISICMYKYLQSRVVRGSVRRAESRRVQEARPALRAAAAYTGHGLQEASAGNVN